MEHKPILKQKHMKKFGIYSMAVLMLCIGTLSTGCFGQFALTRKLYSWNKGLGDKWIQTIGFWLLNFILVYGFCGMIILY